ncbi:MAG: sugar phosphate isomerase/epimerase [Nitrososphaerota archaeon]|nr:sugar phosphate isomerase/epimerase [Nitrososphaerota archaeon]
MKLGFLAGGQLGGLEDTLRWAGRNSFEAVEVLAGPGSVLLDPARILSEGAGNVKRLMDETGVIISSLAWYANNIDLDVEKRRRNNEHLMRMIETANLLDIPVVSTWVGRIPGSVEDNIKVFSEVFSKLTDYAEKHDVRIAIENCMANIAYRPDIWKAMFEAVDSKYIGLEYDPSHLVFQFIDYVDAVRSFGSRIYHTHCKDTEILWDRLSYVGYTGDRWWRFRIPGLGDIDWRSLLTALMEVGYDYVLCVEHEDPFYRYELSKREGFEKGLKIAWKNLSIYLP